MVIRNPGLEILFKVIYVKVQLGIQPEEVTVMEAK